MSPVNYNKGMMKFEFVLCLEWIYTASMANVRAQHTAAVLSNGKVLIVGGFSMSGFLFPTELYDPSTQAWTPTGSIHYGRRFHAISELLDGKVLVTGGYGETNGSMFTNSVELYDPISENWTFMQSMHQIRYGHTASTLLNGKVLVVGGVYDNRHSSNSAELYDPSTGLWTMTGNITQKRAFHTASILFDGRVLIVGGIIDQSYPTKTSELYDPSTGLWTAIGNISEARIGHTAVTLKNGKVLIIGGIGESDFGTNRTELYDPSTGQWTLTGEMKYSRIFHTASLLHNGNVLVAGGDNRTNGDIAPINTTEIYNSSTGIWTNVQEMGTSREGHTASVLHNGNVLVAGGVRSNGELIRTAELFVSSAVAKFLPSRILEFCYSVLIIASFLDFVRSKIL